MTAKTTENVGPFDEAVEVGDRVWVRWNSKVWDGVLVGRGVYGYEVVVRIGTGLGEIAVHRYNVQPQKEDA
jgi:acetyltransferase-like isoleucine patch superfamily enzyme